MMKPYQSYINKKGGEYKEQKGKTHIQKNIRTIKKANYKGNIKFPNPFFS